MSSRHGNRGERNSGGDRNGGRRRDDDIKGRDNRDRDRKTDRRDEKDSGTNSNRRDGERGAGRIFRDKDRERERERDRQERGYGNDRRGYRDGGREKDGRRNRDREDTKRPIILAKPPAASKEKDLEKQRDEEFPTLQRAHHRDAGAKTPPSSATVQENNRASEDRLLEVGKLLLGRHDSVGKSQTNSGNSNIATATTIQPSKAASPRPPAEETLHQPVARATEWLSMDDPPYKEKSVRLVDDLQQFTLSGLSSVLTENPDFLVVGVIGMQGAGKSSILNHLANHLRPETMSKNMRNSENKENESLQNTTNTMRDNSNRTKEKSSASEKEGTTITSKYLEEVFREQSFEKQMLAEHCTSGIKAWISPTTRVIFLDSQPLNSLSILDRAMQLDKKHVADYVGTMEATIEIQSLQIVGFLSMVCHVVLAIQDHFVDTSLIELLHTSNMLRPSAPAFTSASSGDDASNIQQQVTEYFPELVFVHNKAHLEDFTPQKIRKYQKFYANVFSKQSQVGQINWKYDTGQIRMAKAMPHLNTENCSGRGQNVNLFIIPDMELSNASKMGQSAIQSLPEVSYEKLTSELRRRVLAVRPRPLSTSAKLTEKTWLNYSQKCWESVKSSSFYIEYGRILTA